MCPPGVDQTFRSQQRWNVLTPLLKERIDLTIEPTHEYGDPTEPHRVSAGLYRWSAFDKLAQHHVDDADMQSLLPKLSRRCRNDYTSALECLPSELLGIIISDSSLEPMDIIALGLCSETLWLHVIRNVQNSRREAPWANTPLICTGTYLTDVPPAIHSLYPDMAQREKEFNDRPGRGMRGAASRGMCPARKWNWNAVSSYTESSADGTASWTRAFEALQERSGIREKEQLEVQRSLEVALRPRVTKVGWILRKHTTQEYVTLESGGLGEHRSDDVHVEGTPWLTLDKALTVRICWSSPESCRDPTGTIDTNAETVRGPWAGHKFDVVRDVEMGREWRDATAEVVKEAELFK